ncbi:hypothetical protein ACQKNI_13045 [Bacillus sp. NPDC094064]
MIVARGEVGDWGLGIGDLSVSLPHLPAFRIVAGYTVLSAMS